jgi:hypothetical protein
VAFFGSRILTLVPLVALPIVTAADIGSIALIRLSVPDDASEAGRAGVAAIQFQEKATQTNAQIAYDAATTVSDLHGQEIERESFTIYKDGSVQLTVRETAPTVLFKFLPGLRGLTDYEVTKKVNRVSY